MLAIKISAKAKGTKTDDFGGGLKSPAAKRIIKFHMMAVGVDLKSALIMAAPIDAGNLRRSHGYAFDADAMKLFVFNRAKYAAYVHEGRKPGRFPPIDALIPWCRRHIVNSRISTNLISAATAGVTARHGVSKSASKDELSHARSMAFLVARGPVWSDILPAVFVVPEEATYAEEGGLDVGDIQPVVTETYRVVHFFGYAPQDDIFSIAGINARAILKPLTDDASLSTLGTFIRSDRTIPGAADQISWSALSAVEWHPDEQVFLTDEQQRVKVIAFRWQVRWYNRM